MPGTVMYATIRSKMDVGLMDYTRMAKLHFKDLNEDQISKATEKLEDKFITLADILDAAKHSGKQVRLL